MSFEPELGRVAYSEVLEDYLKQIFLLSLEQGRVSTNELARLFQVAPSTVTQTLKRLHQLKLIEHTPYYGVRLTPGGERIARELLRHHRLIELYLQKVLGLPWERVHAQAERWEHVISEEVEERIASTLGDPVVDPHGAPIPDRHLALPSQPLLRLAALVPEERGEIVAVEDEREELLFHASRKGLLPGVQFTVKAISPRGMVLKIENEARSVPKELAQALWVRRTRGRGEENEEWAKEKEEEP